MREGTKSVRCTDKQGTSTDEEETRDGIVDDKGPYGKEGLLGETGTLLESVREETFLW